MATFLTFPYFGMGNTVSFPIVSLASSHLGIVFMQHRQTVLENTQVREILMLAQFFKRTGQCVLALIVATAALAQNDTPVNTEMPTQ